MAHEEGKAPELPHNLVMEGRRRLSASGVAEIESFNEEEVVMSGGKWTLTVRGSGLHMEKLSVETGDILVTGRIDSLDYDDAPPRRGGLFGLFK
ncbi:MAG: YabP/YqfC family sporulation protein [Oscillospiraceae bacterium]|nr:YabP/YqfC family sporulation protein [Oscillospiraceae bacterium]